MPANEPNLERVTKQRVRVTSLPRGPSTDPRITGCSFVRCNPPGGPSEPITDSRRSPPEETQRVPVTGDASVSGNHHSPWHSNACMDLFLPCPGRGFVEFPLGLAV